MILPDFSVDPDFARLRQSIGATSIVQLQPLEWRELNGPGIDIENITRVEANRDGTLSYSGRRVLVYIREQTQQDHGEAESKYRYHIAECRTIQKMRDQGRFKRYVVTTRTDGRFSVSLRQAWRGQSVDSLISLKVCKDCLTTLDWKSYRSIRPPGRRWWPNKEVRKRKEEVWNGFSPQAFLNKYGNRVRQLPDQTADTFPEDPGTELDSTLGVVSSAGSDTNVIQLPPQIAEPSLDAETGDDAPSIIESPTAPTLLPLPQKSPADRRAEVIRHLEDSGWCCEDCGLLFGEIDGRDWLRVVTLSGNLEALCVGCVSDRPGQEKRKESPEYHEFQRWLQDSSSESQQSPMPSKDGADEGYDLRTRVPQVSPKEDVFARASVLHDFCCDCGLILKDPETHGWLKVYGDPGMERNLCLDCYSKKTGNKGTQETSGFKEFQRWCFG